MSATDKARLVEVTAKDLGDAAATRRCHQSDPLPERLRAAAFQKVVDLGLTGGVAAWRVVQGDRIIGGTA